MAEFKSFDIPNALLQGYAQGRERRNVNALNQLASQAYGAPPEQQDALIRQGYAQGAQVGAGVQQIAESAEKRNYTRLGNMARLLVSMPEQARDQYYQQMKPQLQQMGINVEAKPSYDAEIGSLAQQLAQMYGGAGMGAIGVQSTYVDGDGNRVAILRDGTTQILGQNAPNNQIIDTGAGFYGVNKGNLQAAPVMVGVSPQQAPQTMPAGSGAHPNQEAVIAQANQMAAQGIPSEQIDNWVQVQLSQPVARQGGNQFQTTGAVTGQQLRSVEAPRTQDAPAGYRYNPDGTLSAIPGGPADPSTIASTTAARRPPPSPAQMRDIQARQTKYAQAQNVERGLSRIETALQALSGGMVNTGPVDQYVQQFTPAGQELEAAVGGMQNSLLALTRVPGIGSQSDLEARIAMLQYPSLGRDPQVNARTLANLREFITDLKAAYDTAVAEDQEALSAGQRAPAPSDAAPSAAVPTGGVLRYNPATGDFE